MGLIVVDTDDGSVLLTFVPAVELALRDDVDVEVGVLGCIISAGVVLVFVVVVVLVVVVVRDAGLE